MPELRVAHRTSPTNIGMGLLSTLAAHDLGYLRTDRLADRIDGALTTVESLERHEGHLLNWYDTVHLAPLAPRYVSTVDSGNLAGSLLALAAGLRRIAERADAAEGADDEDRLCNGVADTAAVLAESLRALERGSHGSTLQRQACGVALRELSALRTALRAATPARARLDDARLRFTSLRATLERIDSSAAAGPEADQAREWGGALLDALAPPTERPAVA
ncbi:MAG TPA: hypothetical protein VFX50_18295, partial [Gemmatimonadales bacterium]|nr:hypothetical protein [Gemmatimonadales bacterium]